MEPDRDAMFAQTSPFHGSSDSEYVTYGYPPNPLMVTPSKPGTTKTPVHRAGTTTTPFDSLDGMYSHPARIDQTEDMRLSNTRLAQTFLPLQHAHTHKLANARACA